MYFSKLFVQTLKETPAEAELASHKLMLRAGLIRKLAAGIYSFLPLGYRTIRKIENIVREEMDKSGAQEVLMPTMIPSKLWKETGRWEKYGPELLRIKDRHKRDFCLGPTHEEVITDLVRNQISSYRNLPINLYQIQTKVRDEIRPRFGLMRCREFIMKDAYSFHANAESLEESYQAMFEGYKNMFRRCGLEFCTVEADSGSIGGSSSHEFMVMANSGEDLVVSCKSCNYAANMEKANAREIMNTETEQTNSQKKLVETPEKKTVEEVTSFLNISPTKLIKTIIFRCISQAEKNKKELVAALIRGDQEINETKLKNLIGCDEILLASKEEVKEFSKSSHGFAGPIDLNGKIVMDNSLIGLKGGVAGANKENYHYKNIDTSRDFKADTIGDFREVKAGDQCSKCNGELDVKRGIEVGHVFKLGTKYSAAMKATFLDEDGSAKDITMGCYGMGIGRTMAAAIEQNHDERGIIWPMAIAPFEVIVLPMSGKDNAQMELAEEIYKKLTMAGVETILDDRRDRPGAKFKDAELIGFPICVVIGKKTIQNGQVEVKIRHSSETIFFSRENICENIVNIISDAKL